MIVRRLLLSLAIVIGFGAVFASPAYALNCDPNGRATEATLNADGSMDVVEHITYDFGDGCHGGIRQIPTAGADIEDSVGASDYTIGKLTVTEKGEPVPIAAQSAGFVKWGNANATVSGHHVFDISYHVDNAVFVAPDIAVLYWQFVGNDFPRDDHVDIRIRTPGQGVGIQVFVHGALNGVVDPPAKVVHLNVKDNPAGTKVEVRMLEPASDFTVAPSGPPIKQDILDREAKLAGKANARREQLKQQLQDDEDHKKLGNIASPIVAALGALAFLGIFFKWGKEPPQPDDIGDYFRDIPEEPPAVCQALRAFGGVSADAFSATLIDLAQRGWLTITEEHGETGILHRDTVDYRFTRTAKMEGPLNEYETMLLWRLFPNGGSVTQDELVEQAKADRNQSAEWMNKFKAAVGRDFAARGFVDKGHGLKWLLHFLTILVLGATGIGVLIAFSSLLGIIPIVVAVALIPLSGLLLKRTTAGARAVAKVNGLTRFLKDFSRLPDDAHTGDLAIYERYLVYAVALGVSKELVDALRVKFPQLAETNSGFATWYIAGSMVGGYSNMSRLDSVGNIGSFASEFSSATAAAFSPPSSSSGGGGGFSGGGGGGGGGGSSGGW
ncbi:MAG: hypothetical protein QOJ67_2587 [Acidimicrobiaceae bacterium]